MQKAYVPLKIFRSNKRYLSLEERLYRNPTGVRIDDRIRRSVPERGDFIPGFLWDELRVDPGVLNGILDQLFPGGGSGGGWGGNQMLTFLWELWGLTGYPGVPLGGASTFSAFGALAVILGLLLGDDDESNDRGGYVGDRTARLAALLERLSGSGPFNPQS